MARKSKVQLAAEKKRKNIKDDLLSQMELQGKTGKHYLDLVGDYMKLFDIKEELHKDINENGIRYKTTGGNGFEIEKPNESVDRLLKITPTMTRLLVSLGLKEPMVAEESDEDGYC